MRLMKEIISGFRLSALVLAGLAIGLINAIGNGAAYAQSEGQVGNAQPQNFANKPSIGLPPDYKLGSGDKVHITVFGQQDLTGDYLVDGSGMLSFPLIGSVHAGGMTAAELEKELVTKLDPNYLKNPNVSVQVLTYRPFYIVGEVKTPGSYAYVSGMTVINAVALAGGFTYRAREGSFYVDRSVAQGKKERLDATPDTPVQPGDVITVRERYF